MDQPNTYNRGWREYGNRVGAFRIAETLQRSGIRPTLLVNTETYDHAPELMDAFRDLDADIVAHGRTDAVQPNSQDESAERVTIDAVYRAIESHEGTPPRGWMTPGANPSRVTGDLWPSAGSSTPSSGPSTINRCGSTPAADRCSAFRTRTRSTIFRCSSTTTRRRKHSRR